MAVTPESVLWEGGDNMGGIGKWAYYCDLDADIATLGATLNLDTASNFAGLANIQAQHTFNSGKGWKKLYTQRLSGEIKSESQGELDGMSHKSSLVVGVPGARAEGIGFLRWAANRNLIMLGTDAEDANRQVGSVRYPAKYETGSMTTTTTPEGLKITFMTFSAPDNGAAPLYPFDIVIEEGSSGS